MQKDLQKLLEFVPDYEFIMGVCRLGGLSQHQMWAHFHLKLYFFDLCARIPVIVQLSEGQQDETTWHNVEGLTTK